MKTLYTKVFFLKKSTWQKIVNDNSNMRVIEDNKIMSVSFDYYNSIILEKLKDYKKIKVAEFIGILLQSIYLYDTVLTYLVDRLIKQEKIIFVNKEKNMEKHYKK